jgi:hypothetical protein
MNRKLENLIWDIRTAYWSIKWLPHVWYCEYEGHHRFHDYFSIMINNFPIIVIRRMDDPHSKRNDMNKLIMIGILGYTFIIK